MTKQAVHRLNIDLNKISQKSEDKQFDRLFVVSDLKSRTFPSKFVQGTSLCEDVIWFSRSQHYGNSPCLCPRSIWFTNNYLWPPRPGEISEGQNINERSVWKMKNCFKKKKPKWENRSEMKKRHRFLVMWTIKLRRITGLGEWEQSPVVTPGAAEVRLNGLKKTHQTNFLYLRSYVS